MIGVGQIQTKIYCTHPLNPVGKLTVITPFQFKHYVNQHKIKALKGLKVAGFCKLGSIRNHAMNERN